MNVQTEVKTADNGVNVEALLGARAALTEAPAAAQFTWRAECDWVGGVHSRSTVKNFSASAKNNRITPHSQLKLTTHHSSQPPIMERRPSKSCCPHWPVA